MYRSLRKLSTGSNESNETNGCIESNDCNEKNR